MIDRSTNPGVPSRAGLVRRWVSASSWLGLVLLLASPSVAQIHFEDITEASGIDFRHTYAADELSNLLQTTGPGVSISDVDGDGDVDLYFVNGASTSGDWDETPRNELYVNLGGGHFERGGERAGVDDAGVGMGGVFFDYDNDGDQDLYVYNYGPNRLFRNDGEGVFQDVTAAAGVECAVWSAAAVVADIDADGYLDIFISNYLVFDPNDQPRRSMLSYKEGYRFFPGPYDFPGDVNSLYHNNGDGTFTDVTTASGLQRVGKGMGCTFIDMDVDGDQDLMVANDRWANFLYINDGTGRFEERAVEANIAFDIDGFDTGAMAAAAGDVDGDHYPDLLVTNMIFEYNMLYRNGRDGSFQDITEKASFDANSYQYVGWGVILDDFDLDGHLDAFISNGHVQDYIDTFSEAIRYEQPNQIFRNQGDGNFLDVTAEAGEALEFAQVSRGCAAGDLDGDGLSDVVVVNSNDQAQVLRNVSEAATDRFTLQLQGTKSNRNGVGSRIVLTTGERSISRWINCGSGYASQCEAWPRFARAMAGQEQRLEIHWPSGQHDVITPIPAGTRLLAVEGKGIESQDAPVAGPPGQSR